MLPLPEALETRPKDGQKLVIGIRPEAFRLGSFGLTVPVTCEVAELTGPELVVTAFVGTQRIMACLPPRKALENGQPLTLSFDREAIHLFDAESGSRLWGSVQGRGEITPEA